MFVIYRAQRKLCCVLKRHFSANQDILSLKKTELIGLVRQFKPSFGIISTKALTMKNIQEKATALEPRVQSFLKTTRVLESLMLLRSIKDSENTLRNFSFVNPDVAPIVPVPLNKNRKPAIKDHDFLNQFSKLLKQAGYVEIHHSEIRHRIENRHRYKNIELQVPKRHYKYVRIWVKGRKKFDKTNDSHQFQSKFTDGSWSGIFYERVLIATKQREGVGITLKGFKDIPLNHFEVVIPEARFSVPWYQRMQIITVMTAFAVISTFTDTVTVVTEFDLTVRTGIIWGCCLMYYRYFNKCHNQQSEWVLEWKNMLYYKSTSNNSGLVLDIINAAYERKFKEALLVYGIALQLAETSASITERDVKQSSCELLSNFYEVEVKPNDINFASTFKYLRRLGLIKKTGGRISALKPKEALKCLNESIHETISFRY